MKINKLIIHCTATGIKTETKVENVYLKLSRISPNSEFQLIQSIETLLYYKKSRNNET